MAKRRRRGKKVNIRDINDIKISLDYDPIIDKYALETIKILRTKGPKNVKGDAMSFEASPHSDRKSRGNKAYYLGWDVKQYRKGKKGYKVTIWNKTNWQLTHLLENGHLITNTSKRVGYSPPKKHIKPTFDKIAPEFVEEMKQVGIEIEII